MTDIELISHDYYNLGAEAQTVEEIYSAWLEPGNYIISYPKPYWKVWGEGAGAFPIYVTTEDGRVIVTEDSVGVWGDAYRSMATEMETFMFGSNFVSVNVTVAGQKSPCGVIRGCQQTDLIDTMRSPTQATPSRLKMQCWLIPETLKMS